MLATGLPLAACLRAVLLLAALAGVTWCQETRSIADPPPGNFFLLSLGDNTGDVRRLISGAPVAGALGWRQSYHLDFAVQEIGGDLPDVEVVLVSANGTGDADLFCAPVGRGGDGLASLGEGRWVSNHTSGSDYVFISADHARESVLDITVRNGSRTVRGAGLTCTVVASLISAGRNGSVLFELSMVVDYTRRSLAPDEANTLSSIFDKCCGTEQDCAPWRQQTTDFCHLLGNVCDGEGRLLRLDMRGFGLNCSFPGEEISKLTRLEKLELGENAIRGDVHKIIQQLKSAPTIDHLDLSNNALTSAPRASAADWEAVCDVLATGRLASLDLSDNGIQDWMSPCLFFPNSTLRTLDVGGNSLNGTSLPDAFSARSRIRVLKADRAGLAGPIPDSIADAPLARLDLSNNNLNGSIPAMLGSSPVLELVSLGRNNLEGAVPSALAKSRTLRCLWLHRNALASLPEEWIVGPEGSPSLVDVILARNKIQGTFPLSLARARNLLRLHVGWNFLGGTLPAASDLFPVAAFVDISKNVFVGQFPLEWGSMGMFAGLNGSGPAREWVVDTTNETLVPVLDFSDNGISGVVHRYMVEAQASGRVVVILHGNTGLLCRHITGVRCNRYFDGVANNSVGGAADTDPERVDVLVRTMSVPVAQLEGAESSFSPASGHRAGAVGLLVAIAATGAALLATAAGLVAWHLRSRKAGPARDGWGQASAHSSKASPTAGADDWGGRRSRAESASPAGKQGSPVGKQSSVICASRPVASQAASATVGGEGHNPGYLAPGAVPPLRLPQGSEAVGWNLVSHAPSLSLTSNATSESHGWTYQGSASYRSGRPPLSGRSSPSSAMDAQRGLSTSTIARKSSTKSSGTPWSPSFQGWLKWEAAAAASGASESESVSSWAMPTPRTDAPWPDAMGSLEQK
eukprot:evm.model.scf_1857.1 EVM.evm.TU.scf_1857.1   scf_1857:4103-7888(-)